jgi:hypothetical protein
MSLRSIRPAVGVFLFAAVILPLTVCGVDFVRGDADQSGRVTITDAVHVFRSQFDPLPGTAACDDALDVDDNGVVERTDGVFLVMYLFLDGPTPAAPFPVCGADNTEDTLDCVTFDFCGGINGDGGDGAGEGDGA